MKTFRGGPAISGNGKHRRRAVVRAVLGVAVGLLALAAAAFAAYPARHPRNIRGKHNHPSLNAVVFRVSRNGRTMRLAGRAAFMMTCRADGRVAGRFRELVDPVTPKGYTSTIRAPLIKIRSNGTFFGSGSRRYKPKTGPKETLRYHFAGHLTHNGRAAVGRFFANNCSSVQFHATLARTSLKPRAAGQAGLVAAYGFDEGTGTTVTDASGNGNNGTVSGTTWSTSGKYGDALQFNGTSSVVTIPNSASLQLSSGMTLEAWVNPSTVNAHYRDVIYKANDNFYLEATSENASRPDGGLIAGGSYADAFGTSALTASTWSFLTETYDGSTLRLYVNGTQVASAAHTGAIATSTNPLQIGGDSLYGQFFAGLIDNVRVYNVALTAAQIQTDQTTAINSSGGGGDTTPPTQPGTLSSNATSSGEVDLSWGASTDNVGVTGYDVERCSGSGCTNFTQIGTATGTTYQDTSVSPATSYSYRVRATDAAGNLSSYTNTASATTPAAPSGLVAAYGFDEGSGATVADASGNGNNGTVSNTTWSTTGKYGDALQFNGTSSVVTIPNSASLQLSSGMTLEAWVNPSTVNGNWRDVLYKANDNFYLEATSSNASRPDAGLIAGGTYADAFGTSALAANTWSYLAETYDGSTLRLYVNGTQVASTAHTGAIATSTNPLQIGGDSLYGQFFAGLIDNVRVYNVALSAAQIQTDQATAINGGGGGGDTTPPTQPGTLSANAASSGEVDLSWGASTDNVGVTGYDIERCSGSGCTNFTQIAITAGTGTTYKDTTVSASTSYSYRVRATDAGGNLSAYSNTASATTPAATDATPPTQPGTLSANAVSTGEVDLSWGASTDNVGVTGYDIERCSGSGCTNFTQIAITAGTGTTYKDTTVSASTSYSYRVRAFDAAGNFSPYSNTAGATTPSGDTTPPTQPGTLSANAVSSGEIDLSWGASTDNVGVTGYDIERCSGSGCTNFTQIGTTSGTATTYKDPSVSPSTSYSYRVRATDAVGNLSAYSNTASASTPAAPSGLVAAYSFNEGSGTTVADSSGNGNNGTVSGTTWSTAGEFGNALQFNGTSSLVTIPNSASLQLSSGMTLEAWVNPSTVNGNWRDVIYKANDNFYLEATSTAASHPDAGLIAGGSYADAFGTGALAANAWSFLTETYDGSTLRLYVNGTQVASTAHTGAISTSTNPLQIGGDSLYGQFFAGLIDNVRVYNIARTAAQIQTDQTTPVTSGGGGGDTTPPTQPGTLSANAVSTGEIDLSWGASTDNVGVTGYDIERCSGSGCTNFTQIAATSGTGTTYKDTTVSASTSYTYRVRAFDAGGNVSPYSNTVTASTSTQVLVSPRQYAITPGMTAQYNATVPTGSPAATWSVDGVSGGNATVGTISTAGVYTAPATAGQHTVTATSGSQSANATVYVTNYQGTFTAHNDNSRTGQNLGETVLTPANVNTNSFGKLFRYPVDGLTQASPLYVENVTIPGQGVHNVVYVATEHDSVYAFDADGRSTTPLWKDSFINPANGVNPIPPSVTGETQDIPNEIGITGTPVINPVTNTMYVVAATQEVSGGATTYVNRLHAISLTTGAEQPGSPVVINPQVPGTGVDAINGTVSFNNITENQRASLLLVGNEVYVGFANHGFNPPYHGWVLAFNATTLHQDWAFCTTCNAQSGGVWMGGGGVAADGSGNLFFSTGNGTFDQNSGGGDYGDTLLKLSPSGSVSDYFTPFNYQALDNGDVDLASGGIILLPDQPGAHPHEVLAAGKGGTIYVVDRDNMGHVGTTSDNQIVQSLIKVFPTGGSFNTGNYSQPTYFNGAVYYAPVNGPVMAFTLTNGLLSTSPTSQSTAVFNGKTSTFSARGGETAISANGTSNGILWALQSNGDALPGTLHAYNPANLASEYWNSDQAGTRDQLDPWLKFTLPLVANGHVYVVSQGYLTAYGLLP